MSDTDYSQWGEQKIILDFFGGYIGRFLDLGAFDGLTGSNTRGLSDRGWSGLCIEASPIAFPRLLDNHFLNGKIECVNAAVVPNPGIVRFWDCLSQVSTACVSPTENIKQHIRRQYWVAGVTPDQIVERFGAGWDFVSIDIEGTDLEVLKLSGKLLRDTKLICVEDFEPGAHLNENGYYDRLVEVLSGHGFTRLVGRTTKPPDILANSIFAKA